MDQTFTTGSNTLLVLGLLLEKDRYGYEIIAELARRSQQAFSLQEGTLYPLLHNLEKRGAVESYTARTAGGRPRKYYRITKSGAQLYRQKHSDWLTYVAAVNATLEGLQHEPCRDF